jgi:hypothetical protein
MQLIYRGQTYSYNSACATACRPFQSSRTPQSAYELSYRGSTYRVTPATATKTVVQPSEYELIYRGTTYQVNRNGQGKVTAVTSSGNLSKHRTGLVHSVL